MFAVFFAEVGGSTLDAHHGFVLEYGMDRDVDLGFHVDDSEVTLNVCLGKQFSGGELFFRGVRCEKHVNTETQSEEIFDYSHVPGRAVLHRGRHRHGARATTSGNRINLLLWCRSALDFNNSQVLALKAVSDLPALFTPLLVSGTSTRCRVNAFPHASFRCNMVISAPTGSGKTVLFELCVMRLLSKFISGDGKFTHLKGTLKTIYIAPSKALVQEKLRDWTKKLGPLGINCLELTGDNEYYSIKSIQDTDIILTTPEKFDAVTRCRIKDGGLSFFSDIALVLIDEVHLLNDPRGAALEAIISRIKILSCNPEMQSSPLSLVRFLAVSATIPNINDLAQGVKRFGEEMRPVKLTTKVFEAPELHFQKGAQEAAQVLSQTAMTFGHSNPFIKSREQQERLREASLLCSDKQMQSYILYGVAYHNGGLSLKDRNLIEGLFLNGDIQILCTTNTLAHGINLPAHTVVIKSTQHFNKEKGIYMEYERSMILQNPENYSILKGLPGNRIEKHLQEICVQKVKELSEYQMVWTDEDGFLLKPLEPGRLMTKYYLKFDTMKHIIQVPPNCSIEDILHIICRAEEIAWIQLRRNEKKFLNDINNDKDGRLRFHILDDKGKRKKRIQTREDKIFVLVNDCLTGDPLVRDLSMSQDVISICSNGSRIAKCMKEYFMFKKSYKGALNSTVIAKCLHQKLWNDSPYLLKQLPGIGMVTAKALYSMGVMSFETLFEADPRKIELVTGRKYPFGNHIKESLLTLPPKIEMAVQEIEDQRIGMSKLLITLTRLSQPAQSTKRHYADMMVSIEEDNLILFYEKIRLEEFSSPYSATVLFSSPKQGKLTIKADLIFEEFIGIDLHRKVIITPPVDLNVIHKYRPKELSSFNPKDVHIIKDDKDETSVTASKKCHYSNELIENSVSMPSFKLIDEELEDDKPVIETEDDDCKIITERTVFDHIRKKAKTLPFLPMPNDTCLPSLEAFTLIRKRTRERHLELDNDIEVLEVQESRVIQHPKLTEPEPNVHVINGDDPTDISDGSYNLMDTGEQLMTRFFHENYLYLLLYFKVNSLQKFCVEKEHWLLNTRSAESGTLTEETFLGHTTKMPQNYPVFGNSRTADSTVLTLDCGTSHMQGNDTQSPLSSGDNDVIELLSPSLQKGHLCSLAIAGEVKKEDSFLGFQSVFSFL
ncbi:UNVERIFIED_CONTAM: DExH-box ATP-dependent RNA helicase DExH17 [Sesamum radiatum]|uniref:DExH-box ATP-dependent RNA helicase DExH17 n=1 Tax=Sesamum radiatum TaxID=300843 RepID=A0AAW2V6J3_SESRA